MCLETARLRSLQAFRRYELFSKTLTTTFAEPHGVGWVDLSTDLRQLDGCGMVWGVVRSRGAKLGIVRGCGMLGADSQPNWA
jgi:hypothetical protein